MINVSPFFVGLIDYKFSVVDFEYVNRICFKNGKTNSL